MKFRQGIGRQISAKTTYCLRSTVGVLFLFWLCIVSVSAQTGSNQEKIIRHAVYTKFKTLYPDTDGIIWAETFVKHIFEREGYQIKTVELPTKRLPRAMLNKDIDTFISADELLGPYRKELIHSRYPTVSLPMYIYYNNTENWKPIWPPDSVFKQKKGKSKISEQNLREDWGLNVTSSSTFDACIRMVNTGRADYWLDNITGVINSTPGLAQVNSGEFSYELLYHLPLYIYFQPNEQGRALREIYDRGIESILKNGDFIQIFYQYDTEIISPDEGELAVQQIGKMFPDIDIPEQKAVNAVREPQRQ